MLFPGAIGQPTPAHDQNQQHGIEDQHRAGHDDINAKQKQAQRDQQCAEADREHDALEIGQAGEAPDAAIQAKAPEDQRLQRHDPDQRGEGGIQIIRR